MDLSSGALGFRANHTLAPRAGTARRQCRKFSVSPLILSPSLDRDTEGIFAPDIAAKWGGEASTDDERTMMARNARTTPSRKARTPVVTPTKAARTIRASAQKALEAGMQAASGVRQSAVGAFDSLVKQGAALEARSRRAAMAHAGKARDAACARAEEAKAKTVEAVSHLEKVFETRVSKAISKLGVPTARDVRSLSRQVAQLQASVDKLHRSRVRAAR